MAELRVFVFLAVIVASYSDPVAEYCKRDVLPVSNFDYKQFYGVWYEIGKIQTPVGAAFQRGCHCTTVTNSVPSDAKSQSDVIEEFSCRKWWPGGKYSNISAVLTNMDPPGNYTETFFKGEPYENSSKYTVIDEGFDGAGNEYKLVYVCSDGDYCVHFFSRKPVLGEATVRKLIAKAEGMGLNPFDVKYESIDHNDCW